MVFIEKSFGHLTKFYFNFYQTVKVSFNFSIMVKIVEKKPLLKIEITKVNKETPQLLGNSMKR